MKREEGVLLGAYLGTVETRAHFGDDGWLSLLTWKLGRHTGQWSEQPASVLDPEGVAALNAELRRREGGEAGKAPPVPCSVCGKATPMPTALRVYCGDACAGASVAGMWRAP